MRKAIAATMLALAMVPFVGTAAQASNIGEKVDCFFWQTFRERDPEDYLGCLNQ